VKTYKFLSNRIDHSSYKHYYIHELFKERS